MTKVATVILAAGASTRLGEPKQLAVLAGETLLDRAVRTVAEAGCAPIVVVLGARADLVGERCSLAAVRVVVNDSWEEGMASSIRVGIESVVGKVEAAILMTCDQPAVSPGHLLRLAARDAHEITGSEYGGRRGVPGYFPAVSFPELMRLHGDQGARRMLESAPSITLPDGELDIDTSEGLEMARLMYG